MIELNETKNPEIYYDVNKGVDFCRSIPDKKLNKKLSFHTFWIGDFGRKQALPIKSFFATQDLENVTLNLWSTQDFSDNEYLKPFKDRINFRFWNPVEEARGTPIESSPHLNSTDKKYWVDGDLFRLLVLHKYGGVYIDMDIVLLRYFAPLVDQEFMYKWGTEKNMINGAVMHLFVGSQASVQLLEELSQRYPTPLTTAWGNDVYVAVYQKHKNFTVFPAAFFNTEWQIDIKDFEKFGLHTTHKLEPFTKCEQSDHLFDGAFSWHWHGRWNEMIDEGSKWQIFESRIDSALAEMSL